VLLSISELIGHLHPLFVHLPVGILLLGIIILWLSYTEKYKILRPAVPVIFFCGMVVAICSCITGYLLSVSDDYDKTLVHWHQWLAIMLATVSILLYLKIRFTFWNISEKVLSIVLLLLIFITGHLGGSLTHGADYITKPFADIFRTDSVPEAVIKPIPNVQKAVVYTDIIKPILQTKCYSCHGPNKQKGKLRMDDSLMLQQGGKDGKVIDPGKANESLIIKRLLLPVDNEDHMPPKEKAQPSESQIVLLEWWINQGANYQNKVKETGKPNNISYILASLQNVKETGKKITDIPEGTVEKADGSTIEKMKHRGLVVLPVSQNSNWLKVDFLMDKGLAKEGLPSLLSLKKQLIGLKLGYTDVGDSDMVIIAQLTNLTSLSLEHTNITDVGLKKILSNQNLQYLNLVGTQVTAQGILQLNELKKLKSLYLFQTNVRNTDWKVLYNSFPYTQIDSGGYIVPLLQTDTVVIKINKTY
jgi:uncharacterized membrane protein